MVSFAILRGKVLSRQKLEEMKTKFSFHFELELKKKRKYELILICLEARKESVVWGFFLPTGTVMASFSQIPTKIGVSPPISGFIKYLKPRRALLHSRVENSQGHFTTTFDLPLWT